MGVDHDRGALRSAEQPAPARIERELTAALPRVDLARLGVFVPLDRAERAALEISEEDRLLSAHQREPRPVRGEAESLDRRRRGDAPNDARPAKVPDDRAQVPPGGEPLTAGIEGHALECAQAEVTYICVVAE